MGDDHLLGKEDGYGLRTLGQICGSTCPLRASSWSSPRAGPSTASRAERSSASTTLTTHVGVVVLRHSAELEADLKTFLEP